MGTTEALSNICPVCGDSKSLRWNSLYQECSQCRHHWAASLNPPAMINESLRLEQVTKAGPLERYKRALVQKTARSRHLLIDVGSGSGGFLYQNQDLFKRAIGVEVSPACIEFSKNVLRVEVSPQIPWSESPSLATFWHSAEHFQIADLRQILAWLRDKGEPELRVIISVPNGDSILHCILRENDPYYDELSHFQEFSAQSLSMLLDQQGFRETKYLRGVFYSFFGWHQGLLNLVIKPRNALYSFMKRGQDISYAAVIASVVISPLILPLSLIGLLYDLMRPRGASVLTVTARV